MLETLVRSQSLTRNSAVNTDNQQEIGLTADVNWLAGITDGEGCIALMIFGKAPSRQGRFRLQMRVTIANSNVGISDRITRTLDQLGVRYHVQEQASKSKGLPTGRIMRLVHVTAIPMVAKVLETLMPRMADTEKRERGRILLQLIRQRKAFAEANAIRATHCYTKADVDLIMEFLRLTRSKQVNLLAEFLNDQTREARGTKTKKSRAKSHDMVWTRTRVREDAEMPSRHSEEWS